MACIIRECFALLTLLLFITQITDVTSHGGMLEPPMRSIAWRYGFDAPVNYDWMSLYCGGLHTFQQNGGKCGLCGDPYQGPYENDKGGVYDTGIIVRHYPIGLREIEVKAELTAHHKGYFRFKLCPNNDNALTEECLNRYPLQIREARAQGDPYRYYPAENPKLYELHVELPPDVTCDRCVLQWTYTAGNSAGTGPNGRSCLGCGIQETFVNCADISIGGTRDHIPVARGNVNSTRAAPAVIIPARNDIVDLIANGPADRLLDDFMREIGHVDTNTQVQGRPSDSWGFDRNTGFQDVGTAHQSGMSNAMDNQRSHSQFGDQARPRSPWDTPASPMDRGFHGQRQARVQPDPTVRPRRLDFAGVSDPTILRALNNHFEQPSWPSNGVMPTHQTHTSRGSITPPSMTGSRFHSFEPVGRRSHGGVIPSHGHHSTLLGSLNPIVNEITRRQHGRLPSNRLRSAGGFPTHSFHSMKSGTFGNPTRKATRRTGSDITAVPSRSEFRHHDRTHDLHEPVPSSVHRHLPRRIVVHSMETAQHLLRRFPQLRGRVFLSRQAHSLNKHATSAHRYRFRGHW